MENSTNKKVYIAGKMRGVHLFNFPAFAEASKRFRDAGFTVWSPAENDLEEGFDPANSEPLTISHYMERDLPEVCKADIIALIPGWEYSQGVSIELAVAKSLGKEVWCAKTMRPLIQNETIITDPDTGGQKGQKLERFDLIPAEPLIELARVYGRGAKKYADDNWRKGYSWKLSFGAMMRHAWAFWKGEERDELGNHHLACCAWHAFTLMWYSQNNKGTDDRADKPNEIRPA
jgi:hypothetical protein